MSHIYHSLLRVSSSRLRSLRAFHPRRRTPLVVPDVHRFVRSSPKRVGGTNLRFAPPDGAPNLAAVAVTPAGCACRNGVRNGADAPPPPDSIRARGPHPHLHAAKTRDAAHGARSRRRGDDARDLRPFSPPSLASRVSRRPPASPARSAARSRVSPRVARAPSPHTSQLSSPTAHVSRFSPARGAFRRHSASPSACSIAASALLPRVSAPPTRPIPRRARIARGPVSPRAARFLVVALERRRGPSARPTARPVDPRPCRTRSSPPRRRDGPLTNLAGFARDGPALFPRETTPRRAPRPRGGPPRDRTRRGSSRTRCRRRRRGIRARATTRATAATSAPRSSLAVANPSPPTKHSYFKLGRFSDERTMRGSRRPSASTMSRSARPASPSP